ncbi:MAG: hypothetical protein H6824_18030 [Planctomycetaceae bacterium]|nr:hypothetical protein [Planctomycetaceae bacterium]
MSARFTGARSLGDRRRRRLAQDAEQTQAAPVRSGPRNASPARVSADNAATAAPQLVQPRDSIIPSAPWKIAALGILSLALWSGMMWAGQETWGGPLEELFGFEQHRFAQLFSTITLLAATQLSCLILWYRIRSRKDFGGRYRVWFLAVMFWGMACFSATTGAHLSWAEWAYRQWPAEMWRGVTFYWLAPTAICFLALHRLLQKEMFSSRSSRLFWDASWWLAAASSVLLLIPSVVAPESLHVPLQIGVSTLWYLVSTFALLVHARFVVHITNEAAPKQEPRLSRVLNSAHSTVETIAQVIPRPKFLSRPIFRNTTTPDGAQEEQGKATPPALPAKKTEQPTSVATPKQREATVEGKAEADSEEKPVGRMNLRIDPPHQLPHQRVVADMQEADSDDDDEGDDSSDDDDVDMSQLSRKERRRLKKQKRGQRR